MPLDIIQQVEVRGHGVTRVPKANTQMQVRVKFQLMYVKTVPQENIRGPLGQRHLLRVKIVLQDLKQSQGRQVVLRAMLGIIQQSKPTIVQNVLLENILQVKL